MVLPATKTPDELRKLNNGDLSDYFMNHARRTDSGQDDHRYAIRLGSKTIFEEDTFLLFEKFKRAVRKGWTKRRVDGASRWYREDGCFVYRLNGPDGWEWFFRTRTGKLSYGPYVSARAAMSGADSKFRTA